MDKNTHSGWRFLLVVTLLTVWAPLSAFAVVRFATRLQGVYFASRTTIDIPDGFSGQWNNSGVMKVRSATGTDYPIASPLPAVGGSADAGSTLGSGAATKLDTCSTGGLGSTCLTLKQVVNILKVAGQAAQ